MSSSEDRVAAVVEEIKAIGQRLPAALEAELVAAVTRLAAEANGVGYKQGYSAGYDAAHQDHVDGRIG